MAANIAKLSGVLAGSHPVPLDMNILKAMKRSPLGLERQVHRQRLPHGLPARVEEDQDGLAGVELLHAEGGASALPLQTRDYPRAACATSGAVASQKPQEATNTARGTLSHRPNCGVLSEGFWPKGSLPARSSLLLWFVVLPLPLVKGKHSKPSKETP